MTKQEAELRIQDLIQKAREIDVDIEAVTAGRPLFDALFGAFADGCYIYKYCGVSIRRGAAPLNVRVLTALRGSGFEDLAKEFERKIK